MAELKHIGVARKSGRYPWGSGENPNQHHTSFLSDVDKLVKEGLTEKQIADGMGLTTTQLRARKSIAKNEQRKAEASEAMRLKAKGLSNIAIGERMGKNESSVRALLNPAAQARNDILTTTANMLKEKVDAHGLFDVGAGMGLHLGVTQDKLKNAVAILTESGDYKVHKFSEPQLGTDKLTTHKVLAPASMTYHEVLKNKGNIQGAGVYSEDGGRSFLGIEPPTKISSSRIDVRYGEAGGTMDGVIQLRRGVEDISLGGKNYAQVRIAVDDTHYIKGMAVYSKDLPKGIDIRINTPKKDTGNKLDAMKPLKADEENPFGAIVRQKHYIGADGKRKLSAINLVGSPLKEGSGEEGSWNEWSKTLSSQFLSKQPHALAKRQLEFAYAQKKAALDEVLGLTNPTVKKALLDSMADDFDSSAVHLKAAALPRQMNQIILPITSMKDDEVYAPNFRNGERVVLVRHPHGGPFEIPELTVNNHHPEAIELLGKLEDAIGINHRVAARMSGADFDGDTVIVIPNSSRAVKTASSLKGLENFDPKRAYPEYEGMPLLEGPAKQRKMGEISNLITDMTIKGASDSEKARAIRHSMVIIDAEKWKLNHKQSFIDHGIAQLKEKYQGSSRSGASTLISRANSDVRIPKRKARSVKDGGPVDPITGEKKYTPTGESYVKSEKVNGKWVPILKNGQEVVVVKTFKSSQMAETNDARKLSSGTPMEELYADHANKLKALANQARLTSLRTPPLVYSPSAKLAYQKEVATLNAKLNIALKNAPLERQAQLHANVVYDAKRKANPDLEPSELKKLRTGALIEARARIGAKKERVDITPSEWEAIQAGAISNNKLEQILRNTDVELVKKYATPRIERPISSVTLARAKSMYASGYTQSEIADHLGMPVSTLNSALS